MPFTIKHSPAAATIAGPAFAAGQGKAREYADEMLLRLAQLGQQQEGLVQRERMQIRGIAADQQQNALQFAMNERNRDRAAVLAMAEADRQRAFQAERDQFDAKQQFAQNEQQFVARESLAAADAFGKWEQETSELEQNGMGYTPQAQNILTQSRGELDRLAALEADGKLMPSQAAKVRSQIQRKMMSLRPTVQVETPQQVFEKAQIPILDEEGNKVGFAVSNGKGGYSQFALPENKNKTRMATIEAQVAQKQAELEAKREERVFKTATELRSANEKLSPDAAFRKAIEMEQAWERFKKGEQEPPPKPDDAGFIKEAYKRYGIQVPPWYDGDAKQYVQNEIAKLETGQSAPEQAAPAPPAPMVAPPVEQPVQQAAPPVEQAPPAAPPVLATIEPAQREKAVRAWDNHPGVKSDPRAAEWVRKRAELLTAPATPENRAVIQAIDVLLALSRPGAKLPQDLTIVDEARAILQKAGIAIDSPYQPRPDAIGGYGAFLGM